MKNKFFVCGNEVYIKLNVDLWTIVDIEFLNKVDNATNKFWIPKTSERSKTYHAAFQRNSKHIFMHRLILPKSDNKLLIPDHINRNGLDNRLDNLRWVTKSINSHNSNLRSTNESGYTGVAFDRTRKKWLAYITFDGLRKHLGIFKHKEHAIKARLAAEREANINTNMEAT